MGYLLTQIARICELSITSVGVHLTNTLPAIFFWGMPAMISIGAYAIVVPQQYGFGLLLAITISFLASLFSALIYALLFIRLSQNSFAIFSFCSLLAVDSLIKSWSKFTGGILGISGISRPDLFSTLPKIVFLQIIISIIIILAEFVILKTWLGRFLLGIKEDPTLVETMNVSVKKVGAVMIIFAALLAAIQGILLTWRIQFLDPTFGSVLILIQFLTITFVAFRPKIRYLLLSILFVALLPELLRFLHFPSSLLGHLRALFYALILIVVLIKINKTANLQKRFV